ncbi:MAG: 3-phosphoshikimate 1-carboxyvinyltransferase [Lachnospiraceae bacterium]|nr:3-phosphoshikimate 1-carboxyvinyltransferase [Lachnospiraceae bacterium]
MRVTIQPAQLSGTVKAIASKSAAHRLLIAAALADRPTEIFCGDLSQDIEATARALRGLGSRISYDAGTKIFHVIPLARPVTSSCMIDVGESGSTLRFLLPVICALGIEAQILMHGRLPDRPLSPLWEELERHGCSLERLEDGSVLTRGELRGGEFCIAANVSSQFISGLLYAMAVLEEPSVIRLKETTESEGYIHLTLDVLEKFGIRTSWRGEMLKIDAGQCLCSPGYAVAEGDWSNGAFWEAADVLSEGRVCCTGLDESSLQGDRAVRQLKKQAAAGNSVMDVRNVPDLVPILAVLAASAEGTTVFTHADRLRFKESDRIRSTVKMLRSLGADAEETQDGLRIRGIGCSHRLRGGTVDGCGDHRIVMSAAVASIICEGPVVIEGAEAVCKSYPAFWEDFKKLGGKISI